MRCNHDNLCSLASDTTIDEDPNGLVQATPGAAWELELKICISLLFAKELVDY